MFHIDVSPNIGTLIYHVFMTFALLIPFVIAWVMGQKKGFPNATWLTTLAILNGLMIFGSRLGAFSAADWSAFFHDGQWQSETPKTAVGGLLLALIGYQLLKRWFRLPASAADLIMLGLPLGAAFGRIGCLAAGCCYGSYTDGWWGITFGPGSGAYLAQVEDGTITQDAISSLPLYPVQLELMVANLLIFAVLWHFRNKFRPGNLAVTALMLLAINRFGSEFFRNVATNLGETGQIIGGLKAVQWMSLLAAAICALFWWNNAKSTVSNSSIFTAQPLIRLSAIIFPLSVLLWAFRFQLSALENMVFSLSFLPAVAAVIALLWKQEQRNWIKWPSTLLVSGAVMIQAAVQTDSLIQPGQLPVPSSTKYNWWEVGAGYARQNYKDFDETVTGSGCSAQRTIHRDRVVLNQILGVEGAFHQVDGNNERSIGLRFGKAKAETQSGFPNKSGSFNYSGIFGSLGYRNIGVSLGITYVPNEATILLGGGKDSAKIQFSGGIWLGTRKHYSFDMQYRDRQPFLPYRYPDLSVGLFNWGFNDPSGRTYVRLGIANIASRQGFAGFGAFRVPFFQQRMSLESGLYFNRHQSNFSSSAFHIGLKYHFLPRNK